MRFSVQKTAKKISCYKNSFNPLFDTAVKNEFMNPERKLFEFVNDVEEVLEKVEKHFKRVSQILVE